MATAEWKAANNPPEFPGWYLVTLKSGSVEVAKYEAARQYWVQDWMGQWDTVQVAAWDDLPEGYKA